MDLKADENSDSNTLNNDLINKAKKYNIGVLAIDRNVENAFTSVIKIYTTNVNKKLLSDKYSIDEKTYPSILCGKTDVHIDDFKNLININSIKTYYLLGSESNLIKFKNSMEKNYICGRVKPPQDILSQSSNESLLIWSLAVCLIIFLSVYDIVYQKKENFVKITLGESINKIILKNVAVDTGVIISLFLLCIGILQFFTDSLFNIKISILMLTILIIINSLLYLSLYFFNYKEVLSNSKASKKLLSLNYIIKIFTVIVTIIIVSSNFVVINKSIQFYKQKELIDNYRDYYFTYFDYKSIGITSEEAEMLSKKAKQGNDDFYRRYYNKFDSTMLCESFGVARNCVAISANRRAVPYLTQKIKELEGIELKEKLYILMPNKLPVIDGIDNVKEFLVSASSFIPYLKENTPIEIIRYNNARLVYFDELLPQMSSWTENPIIYLNNLDISKYEFTETELYGVGDVSYSPSVIYNISKDEVDKFTNEWGFDNGFHSLTNVGDNYDYQWSIMKRSLYLNTIFSLLILMLEFIIIHTIIKLEYEINAIEFAIKKVLGYSVWQRNRKIIAYTLGTTVFGVIASLLINVLTGFGEIVFISAGGGFVLIFEAFIIALFTKRYDNSNIQNILKGGSL
ncbi:MAG: DUF1430 domain-containing protein [Oscillospiraceae bacterium]